MLVHQSVTKLTMEFFSKPQAILDNVVDLGELVLQFYGLYMDRQPVDPNNNHQKLGRRWSIILKSSG